jgi:hypothetical protein
MILKNQQKNSYKTADKNVKLSDQNVLIKKRLLKITYVILVFIVFLFVAPITNVNSMYENDPEKPIKELLDNIKSSSIAASGNERLGVSLSMPAFSALLVRLSNEASKTADKNIKLSGQNILMQKRLLRITWVMLGINILMFAAQMVKFFGFFNFHVKKNNHITKINDTTAHTDKSEKLDTIDNSVTNDK